MTGTTSSTPESVTLEVEAGGVRIGTDRIEVPGHGDLRVRSRGHRAGEVVELWVGEQCVELVADPAGAVAWTAPGLLATVAGEIAIRVGERQVVFGVRPDKLVAAEIAALVADLEAIGEGLAHAAGAVSSFGEARSRDRELSVLDTAVGLAASAAGAIRRRPIHRTREVVRAVPRATGPRSAADVRWLATHPMQAIGASGAGRPVGVRRERRADLDTLENRGVLAAYDTLVGAIDDLQGVVDDELRRLEVAKPAREAFLTENGNLWTERDLPRQEALARRRAVLTSLESEAATTRTRSGLPDLRPRGARMLLTPRVASEPAYWATFRAFLLAEQAAGDRVPSAAAPVRALDELWEQWCVVQLVAAVAVVLGPPDGSRLVDPGWFSTLRKGPVATWASPRRTIRVLAEPAYADGASDPRKLFPGRPWRPDAVLELHWADGTRDLHVLDAKYRREQGGAPWTALQEVWWKYGEGIGGRDGWPVVRSVWVLWPGEGTRLVGPRMLDPEWPVERLRGGAIGIRPGATTAVGDVVRRLLVV